MKKQPTYCFSAVGIDVAKATLSVCCRTFEGTETALSLRNTDIDVRRKLIDRLSGFQGRIVMESTGHYHWLVALLLTEAGFDVRVVNPILAKQYTSSSIRKVKTDPADASGLARMAALADNLPERFSQTKEVLLLRKKISFISSLGKQIQAMKASLRHVQEVHEVFGTDLSRFETETGLAIDALRKLLGRLENEFETEAKKLEEDDGEATLLETIPGVSSYGAHLMLHWCSRTNRRTAKSWIGFAGLDISSRESGTWHGTCRLTKRGNPYLRQRLYGFAWGAAMNDEEFSVYYEYLKTNGRSHVEALLIIARKIIRIMFKVLETKLPYDPSKFDFGTT